MNQSLQHHEDLLRRLPLPLAQLFRRAQNAKTPLERHLTSYYVWEVGLKLLGAVTLVEYGELNHEDEQLQQRLQCLARPSLGHWWEFLRRLVPILADHNVAGFAQLRGLLLGPARTDFPRAAGLDAALREHLEKKSQARATVRMSELIDRLINYRNREIGHGAAGQRANDFYERMSRALLIAATEVFGRLDVALGGTFIYVGDVRRQRAGTWLVERFDLEGENVRRSESLEWSEAQLTSLPHPDRVYLERAAGSTPAEVSKSDSAVSSASAGDAPARGPDGAAGGDVRTRTYVDASMPGSATRSALPSAGLGIAKNTDRSAVVLRALHPLVLFDQEANEFLFLNARRGKQRTEFLSYTTGRVLDREDLGNEQRELMARILHLEVTSEDKGLWTARSQQEEAETFPAADTSAGELGATRHIGEFELLSELGRGGMGVVYRAWQPSLDRQVALKCLLRAGDPKSEARFAREIRALGSVEHANLVKIFTSGSENEHWFYAMEILEGATLGSVCEKIASQYRSPVSMDLNQWHQSLLAACAETRQNEKPFSSRFGSPSPDPQRGSDATASFDASDRITPSFPDSAANAEALGDNPVPTTGNNAGATPNGSGPNTDSKPVGFGTEPTSIFDVPPIPNAASSSGSSESIAKQDEPAETDYPHQMANLVQQVAEAAHALHQSGIVHRDIKPGNIMISADGTRAVLMDLGLAQLADSVEGRLTRTRQFVGTLRYASPEQVMAVGKLDPRSDVYSLGASLWEALALKPLFGAGDNTPTPELMLRIQREDAQPLRQIDADIPRDLEAIVAKCLEKDPRRRYESARELARDLHRFQRNEPVDARIAGRMERAWRWCRRRPAIAALLACLLVTWVASFVLITWKWREAESSLETANVALAEKEQERIKKEQERKRAVELQRTTEQQNERLKEQSKKLQNQSDLLEEKSQVLTSTLADLNRVSHLQSLALLQNNLAWAPEEIRDWPQDQREWEWHYLRRMKLSPFFSWYEHFKNIFAAAFSPDGRFLATGDEGGRIILRNNLTGEVLWDRNIHKSSLSSIAFSFDSKYLATASSDQTVKIWDISASWPADGKHPQQIAADADCKLVYTFTKHTDPVRSVAFRPHSYEIASLSNNKTHLWRPPLEKFKNASSTLQEFDQIVIDSDNSVFSSLAYSPDGNWLALSAPDNLIALWNCKERRTERMLKGHTRRVYRFAFSPDSKTLVSASQDKTARVWDLETAQTKLVLKGHDHFVSSVAFHPTKNLIATGSWDQTVKLWDSVSGDEIRSLHRHTHVVLQVKFSPGGDYLVTTGADKCIHLWQLDWPMQARNLPEFSDYCVGLAYHPDNRHILAVSASDRRVQVFDAWTGAPTHSFETHHNELSSVAVSDDGQWVAAGVGNMGNNDTKISSPVYLWRWQEGDKSRKILQGHEGHVVAVAFRPGTKKGAAVQFASADRINSVRIWDAATAKQLHNLHCENEVLAIAYSPDGKTLACAGRFKRIVLFDADSGRKLGSIPTLHLVRSLAFHPTLPILAAGTGGVIDSEGYVYICDMNEMVIRSTLRRHNSGVTGLAFHPNGRRLASASEDFTVKLWEWQLGLEILCLKGHDYWVNAVAFSPDGRMLASAGDEKVCLWDATPSPLRFELTKHTANVYYADIRGDGSLIATVSADLTLQFWDPLTGHPVDASIPTQESVNSISFRPDGKAIALARDEVQILEVPSGNVLREFQPDEGRTSVVAYHPTRPILVTASYQGKDAPKPRPIHVWDTNTWKKLRTLKGHEGSIYSVRFSSTSNQIISAGSDGVVRVWDLDTGKELHALTGHQDSVQEVVYHPDGIRAASSSKDRTVRIWNTKTGKLLHTLEGHPDSIWSLAFHPTGKFLVSSDNLGLIKVWHSDTGKLIETLRGHQGAVSYLTYGKDKNGSPILVSASRDNSAMIWDLEPLLRAKVDAVNKPESTVESKLVWDPVEKVRWKQWYENKASEGHRAHAWEDVLFLLTQKQKLEPANYSTAIGRIEALVRLDRLKEAEKELVQFVERDPRRYSLWPQLAALRLKLGDTAGYRSFCKELWLKHQKSSDLGLLLSLGWTACLHPDGLKDFKSLLTQIEHLFNERRAGAETLAILGALHYRTGQWQRARDRLKDSMAIQLQGVPAYDTLLLGMAEYKLGDIDSADQHFTSARALIREAMTPANGESLDSSQWAAPSWHSMMIMQFFDAEAKSLTNRRPVRRP